MCDRLGVSKRKQTSQPWVRCLLSAAVYLASEHFLCFVCHREFPVPGLLAWTL